MARTARGSEMFQTDKRVQMDSPYRRLDKYPSHTKCPKCGLIFQDGVWRRIQLHSTPELNWKLCPACIQTRGGRAGGMVLLDGTFAIQHRQELLNRIHNVEASTLSKRPLERVISIKEERDRIVVSATTEHLVARIGKSVRRDFGGTLELRYAPEDKFATAHWHRDA